jgi:hypothetical protein
MPCALCRCPDTGSTITGLGVHDGIPVWLIPERPANHRLQPTAAGRDHEAAAAEAASLAGRPFSQQDNGSMGTLNMESDPDVHRNVQSHAAGSQPGPQVQEPSGPLMALGCLGMLALRAFVGWQLWQAAAWIASGAGISPVLAFIGLGALAVVGAVAVFFSEDFLPFVLCCALIGVAFGLAYLGYLNGYRLCGVSPCN